MRRVSHGRFARLPLERPAPEIPANVHLITADEAAAILGLTPSWVKARLRRIGHRTVRWFEHEVRAWALQPETARHVWRPRTKFFFAEG
jgi:predicted DNA-binding transcriptional regulator AlpA